jgi:hypothetical protein
MYIPDKCGEPPLHHGGKGSGKGVIHDKDLSRENALFPALNGRDS